MKPNQHTESGSVNITWFVHPHNMDRQESVHELMKTNRNRNFTE